jgi:hypothetical protein
LSIPSFSRAWLITEYDLIVTWPLTWVKWRVPLVEQEILTRPTHMGAPPPSSRVHVAHICSCLFVLSYVADYMFCPMIYGFWFSTRVNDKRDDFSFLIVKILIFSAHNSFLEFLDEDDPFAPSYGATFCNWIALVVYLILFLTVRNNRNLLINLYINDIVKVWIFSLNLITLKRSCTSIQIFMQRSDKKEIFPIRDSMVTLLAKPTSSNLTYLHCKIIL